MSEITQESVLQMSWDEISKAIKDPKTAAQMPRILTDRKVAVHVSKLMLERKTAQEEQEAAVDAQLKRTRVPSTEELAAEAQQMTTEPALAATVESVAPVEPPPVVSVVVDHSEEDAEWKAEGVFVTRDASGKVTRMVQEYQVRDEDGSPIGRPTHLEARNAPELLAKQRVAHENATRAFYRLKKQKLTFKQEHPQTLSPEQIKEVAAKAVEEKDIAKVEDLLRAKVEANFADREKALKAKEDFESGRAISNEFMRRHLHDYNPCEANQKEIGQYFVDHKLEFTLDNLETAFIDLMAEEKLVKVEKPTVTKTPVETATNTPSTTAPATAAASGTPAPAQPAAATQPVVAQPEATPVTSQPAVEATATTPAVAPNAQTTARRPGVNGGIAPGTLSAQRTVPVDPAQARKDFMKKINKMSAEEIRRKKNNDPQFVKELASYGIRIQ